MSKTDDRLELMENNNMLYDCEETLSCIIQKEMRQNRFVSPDVDDYKEGYQLIYNFDTIPDDEYLNPTNSYINLSINVNSDNQPANPVDQSTANYAFGNNFNFNLSESPNDNPPQYYKSYFNTGGSVLNLFHRVELLTNSGQIVFSERFFNQNRTARQYEISHERLNTINAMMGGLCFQKKTNRDFFPLFPVSAGNSKRFTNFAIPLSELNSFFNQSKPIPSCILKDCVLRITLEKPETCVFLYEYAGGPAFGLNYEQGFSIDIQNVYMNYQTIKPFDSINKIVKHNSIQIPYKTKFTVRNKIRSSTCEFMIPLTAANVYNVQLKFIRADYSLYDSQIYEGLNPIYNRNQRGPMYANDFCEMMDDAVIGTDTTFPIYKIRVGDYYYPQYNPIQIQDYYMMTTEALNPISGASCQDVDPKMTYNKASIGCVNYSDYSFSTSRNAVGFQQDIHYGLSTGGVIVAFDLRRSKDVGLSGLTINSQRKLNVMMSGITAIDANSEFDVYITVEYLQILEYKDGKITIMK
jgi:hypothetical protein